MCQADHVLSRRSMAASRFDEPRVSVCPEDVVMGGEEAELPAESRLQRWVRMHGRLTAGPERVFRAWADPEELARWFPERIEGGLAVGSRSVLVWSGRRVWWDVIDATPSHSFVFRWPWLPDDGLVTTVRVTIDAVCYGSRLDHDAVTSLRAHAPPPVPWLKPRCHARHRPAGRRQHLASGE